VRQELHGRWQFFASRESFDSVIRSGWDCLRCAPPCRRGACCAPHSARLPSSRVDLSTVVGLPLPWRTQGRAGVCGEGLPFSTLGHSNGGPGWRSLKKSEDRSARLANSLTARRAARLGRDLAPPNVSGDEHSSARIIGWRRDENHWTEGRWEGVGCRLSRECLSFAVVVGEVGGASLPGGCGLWAWRCLRHLVARSDSAGAGVAPLGRPGTPREPALAAARA
jgi:hypothetical protein